MCVCVYTHTHIYIVILFLGVSFFKNFLMWTIFKVFMEFVTILLLFYVLDFLVFCHPSCFPVRD